MQQMMDTNMEESTPLYNKEYFQTLPEEIDDWTYTKRREMQLIIPGLWVGPYSCSRELELLLANKITHILIIRDPKEAYIIQPKFRDNFQYEIVEATESPSENLIRQFPRAKQFIDHALNSGGSVYVHCNNGISRSPTFVISYLMETYELDFQTAFNFVQGKRFCVNPSVGFKMQLKEYEPIYNARNQQKLQQEPSRKTRGRDRSDDEQDTRMGQEKNHCPAGYYDEPSDLVSNSYDQPGNN